MHRCRIYVILIGIGFLPFGAQAQEIRFSQYQAAPAYINPASLGATLYPTLRINSRIQQFGVVSFRTGYASLSLPIFLNSSNELPTAGLGVSVLQDVAGESSEFRTTLAQLSAAYTIYLNRKGTQWISFGLQAGYRQVSVDFSQLQWPSQLRYNGFSSARILAENVRNQAGVLSINSGLFWSYDASRNPFSEAPPVRLYAGFSLQNINEPTYNFFSTSQNALNLGYSAFVGAEFWLNDRWTLAPDALVLWYEPWLAYQAGTSITYHAQYSTPSNPVPSAIRFTAGTWYRDESSLVFLLGMGGQKWQAALSYDANLGAARRGIANQYVLELSLQYRWMSKKTPKSQSTPLY